MFAITKHPSRIALLASLSLAALGVALAGIGVHLLLGSGNAVATAVPLSQPLDPPAPPTVLVFVSGAVNRPGLYRLSSAARGTDAIAAAGGLTPDADFAKLPNLAARVHDGHQLNVPARKTTAAGATAAKLDINTATIDELIAVPGMPPGLPEAIVQYRVQWGGFTSITELRTMLGVDSATTTALGKLMRVIPG